MNSYNRTKKGSSSERFDRPVLSRGIASAQISIATLKNEGPFPIDAVLLGIRCRPTLRNRFRRQKKLCNRRPPLDRDCGDTVMRNHLLSWPLPREGNFLATDFVTDFWTRQSGAIQRRDRRRAEANDVESDPYIIRGGRLGQGGGGRSIRCRPNCPIGILAQKIFCKGLSIVEQHDFQKKWRGVALPNGLRPRE